jgi:predicted nucleotidyltransferase
MLTLSPKKIPDRGTARLSRRGFYGVTILTPDISYYKNILMEENIPFVNQIVDTIVSTISPDKIILFGSYARGDYKKNSDIDILIIKKGLKNERDITNTLYMEFYNRKITIPVDLIAIDYDKYNKLNNDIGYIYKTIEWECKVLYE